MLYYKTIHKWFTLVEMLIVVVIIGILAAALIPRVQSAQSRARDVARIAHMKDISTALELYSFDSASYPTGPWYAINTSGYITSADTEWKNSFQDQLSPYIKSVPTDPQDSRAYVYGYVYNTPASYYRLYADYELKASDKWLVGYRNMETLSGAKLRDMSGNGNEGTINGTNFVWWIVWGAMNFDGVDDYIALPKVLANKSAFSVSIWAQHNGSASQEGALMGNSVWWFYFKKANVNNSITLWITNSSNVGGYISSNTKGIEQNVWHLYTITVNSNWLISFFRDNELVSSVQHTSWNYFNPAHDNFIGRYANSNYVFNGSIDDVRIYDRALSALEIKDLYNSRK